MDIYLSVASPEDASPKERANLLFINNGDNTFTESAEAYGIDDTGFGTHAVFLDYNKNGLLDLFILNHSPGSFIRDSEVRAQPENFPVHYSSHDRLYKNNGNGTFTDVSKEAGVLETIGYGLGIVVADFNRNGWPDIYVSNDITPNDVLYINNKDGTYSDQSARYFKQTSFSGMGTDAADFNNDGWPDILQVDMMPKQLHERKTMSGVMRFEHFKDLRKQGFHYYYTKNSLQLNNGIDKKGDLLFSDIAHLDNVAYTDWSWGALFGDYNNSGAKDILITNGFPKAIYDYDYFRELNNARHSGTNEEIRRQRYQIIKNLHDIKVPNYLFRNEGDL
ncbi:MAG: VCBS repeat-containing protein, partial [Balneolales bacterium]